MKIIEETPNPAPKPPQDRVPSDLKPAHTTNGGSEDVKLPDLLERTIAPGKQDLVDWIQKKQHEVTAAAEELQPAIAAMKQKLAVMEHNRTVLSAYQSLINEMKRDLLNISN